jgi:hypothetical protein
MDNRESQQVVAGEPSDPLIRALGQGTHRIAADGMWRFDLKVDPVLGAPLIRALMRVEADLLRNDADLVSVDCGEPTRTYDQRRADAFVVLVERLTETRPTA